MILDTNLILTQLRRTKMTLNDIDYQKLECIHVALQDLQNKYSIPEDDSDLDDAFKFVEDIRDKYLKENEDE